MILAFEVNRFYNPFYGRTIVAGVKANIFCKGCDGIP